MLFVLLNNDNGAIIRTDVRLKEYKMINRIDAIARLRKFSKYPANVIKVDKTTKNKNEYDISAYELIESAECTSIKASKLTIEVPHESSFDAFSYGLAQVTCVSTENNLYYITHNI